MSFASSLKTTVIRIDHGGNSGMFGADQRYGNGPFHVTVDGGLRAFAASSPRHARRVLPANPPGCSQTGARDRHRMHVRPTRSWNLHTQSSPARERGCRIMAGSLVRDGRRRRRHRRSARKPRLRGRRYRYRTARGCLRCRRTRCPGGWSRRQCRPGTPFGIWIRRAVDGINLTELLRNCYPRFR